MGGREQRQLRRPVEWRRLRSSEEAAANLTAFAETVMPAVRAAAAER
jgi:hypothetical protein